MESQAEIDARLTGMSRANQLDGPLFKFRGFDVEKDLNPEFQGYAASLLRDGLAYCASPFEMNDPWEGRPSFHIPTMPPDHPETAAFIEAILEGHPEDEKVQYRELLAETGLDWYGNQMQDMHRKMHRGFGIYSMATDCTHPLQWSHYANGHRGFCFVINPHVAPFAGALRVDYSDEHPEINWPTWKKDNLIRLAFLTKARHWVHEGEYRILLPQTAAPEVFQVIGHNGKGKPGHGRYLRVPPDAVIGIIFGHNIRKAEAGALVRLSREYGRSLQFRCAMLHRRKYEMATRVLSAEEVGELAALPPPGPQ